jgi:hypothetical protein
LLKHPEYAVQCNADALQDGAYHNRQSRDDLRILNRSCAGLIFREPRQQFLLWESPGIVFRECSIADLAPERSKVV